MGIYAFFIPDVYKQRPISLQEIGSKELFVSVSTAITPFSIALSI